MPIFPNDGEGIRSYRDNIADARGGSIAQLDIEHLRIGLGPHVLVPAAAGGTRAGRAQQLEWIDARMIVVPCDREFPCLFIGRNACWFFVHVFLM